MTPGARDAAAIEILDAFTASQTEMADKLLARWARGNRYAGSKDRAAIADRVYNCLRRWGSYGAEVAETGRGRVLASLRAEGLSLADIEARFSGARYAPPPLNDAERAALAGVEPVVRGWAPPADAAALDWPALDWPDWLRPELARSVDDPAAEVWALTQRAAFDLRVNTLKTDRDAARERLAAVGVATSDGPASPLCLRVAPPASIQRLGVFLEGWVEPQDAASQATALLAAALAAQGDAPVLDYCAGGGGKTLALAAAFAAADPVIAYDFAPQRMVPLGRRAERAGAAITFADEARLAALDGRCRLVLVDAPCSGSGAWARNPDAKWRLTDERLEALRAAQAEALRAGARYVAPGGALVYATCSLLRCENEDQSAAFLAQSAAFEPLPISPGWRGARLLGAAPDGFEHRFTPARDQTDGFYVAAFRRTD